MAKMWAGRFTKELNKEVNDFNSSISFDGVMYESDIIGSIAHATMLGKKGIISLADSELICKTLAEILDDINNSKLDFDYEAEDIHMFIEQELTNRIGEIGKRPLITKRQLCQDILIYKELNLLHLQITY